MRAAREAAGYKTPTDAARAHRNIGKDLLISNENGNRPISRKAAEKYAEAFGVKAGWILFGDADPDADPIAEALEPSTLGPAIARSGTALPYAGVVQAGAFLAVEEYFNQDPEGVPEFVLADPKYRKVRQYAYRARGDSMNQVNIHDGMWVVAADAPDFIDVYGDIATGDLVIVERTRFQGAERELTVKQVHFFKDRYELRPCSTNAEHQVITVPHNHSAEDGIEVKIIGVVLTAYANLRVR